MLRLIVVVLLATLLLDAAASAADPTFANHPGPADIVCDAGEPSIGFNPKAGGVMFQASTATARVDFSKSPPEWQDASYPGALLTLDPILFTDRATGRTFTSQLILACSITGITDDDGGSWVPSQGCGEGTAVDHQTIGA